MPKKRQKKEFSYDGILWFPKSEFKQAQIETGIARSQVIWRNKICYWCGRTLPKGRSKYCSDSHRNAYYRAKRKNKYNVKKPVSSRKRIHDF